MCTACGRVGWRFVRRDNAECKVRGTTGRKDDHRPGRGALLPTQPQYRPSRPQTGKHTRMYLNKLIGCETVT